MAEDNLDK